MSAIGSFTQPKNWDDSGEKGDVYYSKPYLSFFILKKDGNPSEHNWYFPSDERDNDNWIYAGNNPGTMQQPKQWSEYGKEGCIYHGDGAGYLSLKTEGNPSEHNWYFPEDGTSNGRWEFIQWRAGIFTDPKQWDDSGEKGDIYYSKPYLSFYILKKDGNPSEHNWYFPSDERDNDNWIYAGNNPGTMQQPKQWSEYGIEGCIYHGDGAGYLSLKTEGNPSEHNWYFPEDGTSNGRWEFIQWRAGIFTDPKQWDDSGTKGDIYYSESYLSFFILKKDGNPSEHNWYFPSDKKDNDQWIVKGNITKQEWIKYINDERPINQISLPGTHDSATYTISTVAIISSYAKTQDDSIFHQLDSGVRFIDARCRHISDIFAMHHGSIYLGINFGTVLNDCYKFLAQHPDEFILMSIKKEHTDENNVLSFNETFETKYYDQSRWFVENRIPKLKEVRGKIVLLRRFSGGSLGINAANWPDNQTFNTGNKLHVQDEYNQHNEAKKWHAIRNAWDFGVANSKKGWLTLNFTSIAADTFTSPRSYAMDKNPELVKYISGTKVSGGVVISDFHQIGKIAENVIITNFGKVKKI